MRPFASKEELLDFQDRWLRPAGILAIVGAFLFAASLALQQVGVADNDAERLTKFHEHTSQLILGQGVIQGIAFLCFTPPLYVLFRCAQGRSDQVRGALVAFAFIGPVLFAASNLVLSLGLKDVSQKFVDQLPAKQQEARQHAAAAAKKGGASGGKAKGGQTGTTSTGTTPTGTTAAKSGTQPSTTGTQSTGTGTTGTGTTGTGTTTSATTTTQTPDQAATDAKDNLAKDLIDNSGAVKTGALLRFPAILGMVIALIYIPLWAMRTGLLNRFWATLGMALGASLILLPFGILGLVIWFAALGLMLAGWWPGPPPPAWAAGEAIPWPTREDLGQRRGASRFGGPMEGSGREVSEKPLPEEGAPPGPVGAPPDEGPPSDETQGRRRKKRKRRS
jgi:hypothetical protein